MSEIAASLKSSKGTLYNYFDSKDKLLRAYIEELCAFRDAYELRCDIKTNETGDVLIEFGKRFLGLIGSDQWIGIFRICCEAHCNVELSAHFSSVSTDASAGLLVEILERANRQGRITIDDPVQAAEEFLALLAGSHLRKRLLKRAPAPSLEQIEEAATKAVERFFKIYPHADGPDRRP